MEQRKDTQKVEETKEAKEQQLIDVQQDIQAVDEPQQKSLLENETFVKETKRQEKDTKQVEVQLITTHSYILKEQVEEFIVMKESKENKVHDLHDVEPENQNIDEVQENVIKFDNHYKLFQSQKENETLISKDFPKQVKEQIGELIIMEQNSDHEQVGVNPVNEDIDDVQIGGFSIVNQSYQSQKNQSILQRSKIQENKVKQIIQPFQIIQEISIKIDIIKMNQSIRSKTFGSQKEISQHESLIKKGKGVGVQSISFFIRKSYQSGKNNVFYSINAEDNLSNKCQNLRIEIRELKYEDLQKLMDVIYSIMSFQIGVQKYKGAADWDLIKFKKRTSQIFKLIFEFWAENQKGVFSIFLVEEKIKCTLRQYLTSIAELEYGAQKNKVCNLLQRLWFDIEDIFLDSKFLGKQESDIAYFFNFTFNGIFLKYKEDEKIGKVSKETPAYSFRNKNLCQAGNIDKKITEQIVKGNVKQFLINKLYQTAKNAKNNKLEALVKEIEQDEQYDFNEDKDIQYDKYIGKQIDLSISQKRINKFKKYALKKVLGQGSFGVVFEASLNDNHNNPHLALKQINNSTLKELSQTMIESQFLQFFTNDQIPLMELKDIYLQQYKSNFILSLVMVKGTFELIDFLNEKHKGLNFLDFFHIFKDLIIGITFIHSHCLTHGDIKPANILFSNRKFSLCDYGEGVNLYYEAQQKNKIFFQIGEWVCVGTPKYCAPIIKQELKKEYPKKVFMDLYKNDNFSIGITLYRILTGKSAVGINESIQKYETCIKDIQKLKIPIQIRNAITHMIQFESSNRITSFSMHACLKDIMERITNSTKLTILKTMSADKKAFYRDCLLFDPNNHDWFNDFRFIRKAVVDKFYKIKRLTTEDQTFLSGQLKPDYNPLSYENQRKLQKQQFILLKSNYAMCTFQQENSIDEVRVMLHNKIITVKRKEILTVQFQQYKQGQNVEVYDAANNSWLSTKIMNIHNYSYSVSVGNSKDSKIQNSQRVKGKTQIVTNYKNFYLLLQNLKKPKYKKKFSFSKFVSFFKKKKKIPKKSIKVKRKMNEQTSCNNQMIFLPCNTLKLRLCLCLKCCTSEQENMDFGYQVINEEESQLLSYYRSVTNSNQLFHISDADLGKPMNKYSYEFQSFEKNSQLKGITNILCNHFVKGSELKLGKLLYKGMIHMLNCREINLNAFHLGAFQYGALKLLRLEDCEITSKQLVTLFKIFSYIKLQRLYLMNFGIEIKFYSSPTQKYQDRLKEQFAKFANSQQELYHFDFCTKFSCDNKSFVMKAFQDLHVLINKYGHHFRKGNFSFRIPYVPKDETEKFANTIKGNMDQYFSEWKCEYGDLGKDQWGDNIGDGLIIESK